MVFVSGGNIRHTRQNERSKQGFFSAGHDFRHAFHLFAGLSSLAVEPVVAVSTWVCHIHRVSWLDGTQSVWS